MKRVGNLFDKIFTKEALFQAYLDARKGKRSKRSTFEFETNLGGNLAQLLDEIHGGIYHPRPYHTFFVYEPKRRLIHAPAFRDRVVQHAIYRVIAPLFDKTFVADSYACRIGYGTHRAANAVQKILQTVDPASYVLQLDIRKFFYRIDRNILRAVIEKKIKDARLIDLMMLFADHADTTGIPIGNLLSQLYALIYLNTVDQFIKRTLKVKYYLRYVDDMLLIGLTREQALAHKAAIIDYLQTNLRLELSRSSLYRAHKGINFVGYRTWRRRRFIRKHSLYKFRHSVLRGDDLAVISILGHAKNTASLPYMINLIKEHGHDLSLPKSIRRLYHLSGQPS